MSKGDERPLTSLTHRLRNRLTFGRQRSQPLAVDSSASQADARNKKKLASRAGWTFRLCSRTDSCLSVDSTPDSTLAVCTNYRRTSDVDGIPESPTESCGSPSSAATSSLPPLNERLQPQAAVPVYPSPMEERLLLEQRSAFSPAYPERLASGERRVLQNSPADSRSGAQAAVQVGVSDLALALRNQLASVSPYPYVARWGDSGSKVVSLAPAVEVLSSTLMTRIVSQEEAHSQADFVHRLIPDLLQITGCSFYWGKMDRYEAERLLDNKPEGTFLLRDSAHEEHLFSVSFRRFERSLHARIEQWNDRFSFDSHDPGVFSSTTVSGLIRHYKDPSHCMFFEPMLTQPLHRNFVFSLQHLCRATVCSRLTYSDVDRLELPRRIRSFLKEYHYRKQVRVRSFE